MSNDKHTAGRLQIVFDGPPGPTSGRFVEAERDGRSVNAGTWIEREGGLWALEIDPAAAAPATQTRVACSPEMVVHLARELWRATLMGNPAPYVRALGERMMRPRTGDLVVSKTGFTTPAVRRMGVLEKKVREPVAGWTEPAPLEDVWYIRTDAGPTRWTNEEFYAIPPLDRKVRIAQGWPE